VSAVVTALLAAIITAVIVNWQRLLWQRQTIDAGDNASVLPILSVIRLLGFGPLLAAVPAFAIVRSWVTLLAVCGSAHCQSYFDIAAGSKHCRRG
jgi:hypothetical protein